MKKHAALFIFLVSMSAGLARAEMTVELKVGTTLNDRTVVDPNTAFAADTAQLVGWSRVKGATEPVEIYHRWRRNGKDEARVKLPVRSSNYRVWSFCAPKGRTGSWTLEVLDWDGNVLATTSFEIR